MAKLKSGTQIYGTATIDSTLQAGNVQTTGLISATGNVTAGNILTGGIVSSTGNAVIGNIITSGLATVTGNITGGNLVTAGLATVTGNVTGGNLLTAGLITATGNIQGGNLITGGLITVAGNIIGGNLITGGLVSVTGTVTANGNITASSFVTTGVVTATGNIQGGNLITAGALTATGNIFGANISGGNILTSGLITAGGFISASGNVIGSNVISSGILNVGIDAYIGGATTNPTALLHIAAGTATANTAPLKFTSGTVLTVAEAGTMEYDGTVPYFNIADSTRGAITTEQWVVLSSTNTLTSQTGAQPIFDGGGGPTNGAVTLPVGTYQFECNYALTGMSSTSGSFGFALGGGATKTFAYQATSSKASNTITTAANSAVQLFQTGNTTTLQPNSSFTTGMAMIKGVIRITVAGTIIPSVSLTTASAAVVQSGSYFRVSPIGGSSVTTVGNWS